MIENIVEKAVEQIADVSDPRVLRDNGNPVALSKTDKAALAAAMEVARAVDAAYRAEEGLEIPSDDFAKGGAWHRAANLLKARLSLYGGDLVHRVLMASVSE